MAVTHNVMPSPALGSINPWFNILWHPTLLAIECITLQVLNEVLACIGMKKLDQSLLCSSLSVLWLSHSTQVTSRYVIILCIAISGYSIFDSVSTLSGTFYESSSRKTKTDICQVQYDMWSEVGAQVYTTEAVHVYSY